MSTSMKASWMGRDLDTLSREELIDVTRRLGQMLESARDTTRSIIEVHAMARRAAAR